MNRRQYLGLAGTLSFAGMTGCLGGGNGDDTQEDDAASTPDGPEAPTGDIWADHPVPDAETGSFTLGRSMPGIDFEPLVDIQGAHVPEGLAYKDGHIYTGERDSPCTIREYTIDGEKTEREYTFDDRPGVDHTNTMDWFDGNLWVSDSSTSRTYIIDWGDDPEIVDEFAQEDPYGGTWRMILPTSDGVPKIVANEWLGPDAWIFDLESVLEDGTWKGNVDRTIRNGFFTNPQTMYWHEGDLYTTTHDWVIKSSLPYADEIESGEPLIRAETIEYAWDLEVGSDRLEQLVYNADEDEYYLCDRGDGGILFRGVETERGHKQRPWSMWPTATVGEDETPVIHVDEGSRELGLLAMTRGYGAAKTGWVDTWVYDSGSGDIDSEISFLSTDDDRFGIEIGPEQDWGEERYTFINEGDGDVVDTQIPRAEHEWIKVGWEVEANAITTYLWTADEGWESVETVPGDHAGSQVAIRHWSGETYVGDWTVALE